MIFNTVLTVSEDFTRGSSDLEQLLPVVGTVNGSRFIIGVVDTLQTGKNTEGNEWYSNKNTYKDFPGKIRCQG